MRVECIETRGEALPEKHIVVGYTRRTVFDLTRGQSYLVYAMSLWNGLVMYLLLGDESATPHWYPATLFRVADDTVPPTWKFAYWGQEPGAEVQALWGYDELVRDPKHFDMLAEHEETALRVFETRRLQLES